MGSIKNLCTNLVKNLNGRDHLGRRIHTGKDNIKTDLKETDVDWNHLVSCEHGTESSGSTDGEKFLNSLSDY
jgi:hypothetical protein